MVKKFKLKVFAKINLSLNICGLLGNLHELDMVLTSVDIADVITVCLRSDAIFNIEFARGENFGRDNSVSKMIEILGEKTKGFGADIIIEKGIPACAGLGGSSADAAGVLIALDNLIDLNFCGLERSLTALKAGSDVPYMLEGGFARVKSTGQNIEKIKSDCEFFLVICKDINGVSTKDSYAKFDSIYPSKKLILSDNDALKTALENGENLKAIKHFDNALYLPSSMLEPSIKTTINSLNSVGAYHSFMTGSGSACVGIFNDFDGAKNAAKALEDKGLFAKPCKTLKSGIEFL